MVGATGGIGQAVARQLAADGFYLCLGGRNRGRLDALAREVEGLAVQFDLGCPEELKQAHATVTANWPVDTIVNCAGVFDLAPAVATEEETLERNLKVNLRGAFFLVQTFLPAMIQNGKGLIVTVGSVAGRRAFPGNAAYSASKFGLRGFHEVLLEELRGTGVRASLLEPGAVDTQIWDPLAPDSNPDLPSRGRMLRPEDVAHAVSFLTRLPNDVSVPYLPIERI